MQELEETIASHRADNHRVTHIAQTEEVSASASAHQVTLARADVLSVHQAAALEAGEIGISLRT